MTVQTDSVLEGAPSALTAEFKNQEEILLEKIEREPLKWDRYSPPLSPHMLQEVYGIWKTDGPRPLYKYMRKSEQSEYARRFIADLTSDMDVSWYVYDTSDPTLSELWNEQFATLNKIKISAPADYSSYINALNNERDFERFLTLAKLWPTALQANPIIGGPSFFLHSESNMEYLLASGLPSKILSIDAMQYEGIPSPQKRREGGHDARVLAYTNAIARFPELYLWYAVSQAMKLAQISSFEDEATAFTIYSHAVNRIEMDKGRIDALVDSPLPIRVSVSGHGPVGIRHSKILPVLITPQQARWLPRPMYAADAIKFAIVQAQWLIESKRRDVGSRALQLADKQLVEQHPRATDPSWNIFLVQDVAESLRKGSTVFKNAAVSTAPTRTRKTIVASADDPNTAWVPSPKHYAAEPFLYERIKRDIPTDAGFMSRGELGGGSEEGGSILPWILGGAAAAAVAALSMK